MDGWLFLLDALAIWRLTRLVTTDDFPPIKAAREWVLRRWPSSDTEFTDDEIDAAEWPEEPEAGWEPHGWVKETRTPVVWTGEAWSPRDGHWLGKLITCPWCTSVWVGLGFVPLLPPMPLTVVSYLGLVMAFSGLAGLISSRLDH